MAACALALLAPAASADTKYGDLTFPQDESAQPASWDYWWGAGSVVAKSGRRYVIGMAFTSYDGVTAAGYQVFPLQGPYKGQSIMTEEGPVEWGHPQQPTGRFVERQTTNPGPDERLQLETLDTSNGLKAVDRWERTSLDQNAYRFTIDQDAAKIHPTGERVGLDVDLLAQMRSTPLLAGGTGRWFYHVPEDFHFPSRGYQYQQAAQTLTGTLRVRFADGSVLDEQVDPARSLFFMEHESDPPEDIPGGLGIAALTQVHPRYAQYYNLQWPWELVFADLGNGAQLMFDLQSYHDTPNGLAHPITPQQPTYRVLATLRLPSGESVPLNSQLHAEHLEYRTLDTITSATGSALSTRWVQAWKLRVSYGGGTVDGLRVPPFDLGFAPPFGKDEPQEDAKGNRLTQRVPYDVSGSYDGCPVHGFAWSEMLVNWYGWEDRDPWFTGGALPPTPKRCLKNPPPPPSGPPGDLNPPSNTSAPPDLAAEGCSASAPDTPTCSFVAAHAGGVGGDAPDPDGWRVTITRPGQAPFVVHSHSGYESYPCGTVRAGDQVVVTATEPGARVYAGDPAICF